MSELKEVFFDGVESIHILNGTVRMDFFYSAAARGEQRQSRTGSQGPVCRAAAIVSEYSFIYAAACGQAH